MSPIEQGGLTPEEKARITKSITSREQAPSTRQQAAEYSNWRALANSPNAPFNVERIPMNMLRQMRRDPMISFALHFIRTPIIRAPWYIKCEDAQVAAFIDYTLRRIYTRLVLQYMLSLDFGFVAVAKKFVQEPIIGTYFDPNDPDKKKPESPDNFLLPGGQPTPPPAELQGSEKPIWSEGSVLPYIWKPFVPLPPEDVEPIWNKGEFDGIKFTPAFQVQAGVQGSTKASNEGDMDIDLYHSLWITNDRDSVFGNIFGYPRIGPAFNYWWSYWHHHALYDRHFEKDADPPTVVKHPEGNWRDEETGETIAFRDLALDIGDRVRAGSTIAIPSEVYTNFEDRPSNTAKWEIDFLRGGGNFEAFIESFDYLNVMKLRAVWVPEQALIEGKGGQSSRNVADTFGDAFQESQAVLLSEFDLHINQFVIPQLIAVNFPEFEGKAEKVTRGFSNKDVETMRQLIQLTGQKDLASLPVDTRQMLEELGLPLLDIKHQAANAEQAGQENNPGAVPAIANQQAGVVPTGGTASNPAQAGILPFSYVQPPERISLSANSGIYLADEFVASLPNTDHYADKIIKSYASQMYRAFNDLYDGQYKDFAAFLADENNTLELAISDKVRAAVNAWTGDSQLWANTIIKLRELYRNTLARAGRLALRKSGLTANFSIDDPEINEWLNQQLERTVQSISSTIKDEIALKTSRIIEDMDEVDPVAVADQLRLAMGEYPDWQATRAARTEIRDLWNGATLLAGQAAGVNQAQAVDARFGPTDDECEDRDGEIFSIEDAMKVDEHPNGTLAWRLLASTNIKIEKIEDEQQLARFDPETETIYLSDRLNKQQRTEFLKSVGGSLQHGSD